MSKTHADGLSATQNRLRGLFMTKTPIPRLDQELEIAGRIRGSRELGRFSRLADQQDSTSLD